MKKILAYFLMAFILLNSSSFSLAKGKPEDEFYSSLTTNVHMYKEYKNATLNIRKLIDGSELKNIDKELGKYSFGELTAEPLDQEIYFFASIYENKHMIVKKYAIYNLQGKLLTSGHNRLAKKASVLNGEFSGWKSTTGLDELANENPGE